MVKVKVHNLLNLARTRTISIFYFLQRVGKRLCRLSRLCITALPLGFKVHNLCTTCSEVVQ